MTDETTPTEVHRVTLLIVNHDRLGADSVKTQIENVNYPNDCVSPKVVTIETRRVDWHDGHPLNQHVGWRAAYDALFPAVVAVPHGDVTSAADPELAPANDLCGGCGADRAADRCSAGCGWELSLLPDPTPMERALLDIAAALGVDAGFGSWLERTVAAAADDARVLGEVRAQRTVALNAIAGIAADLGIAVDQSARFAPWVDGITKAIREKTATLRTATAGLQDVQANAHAQQAALRDIGAALGIEGEALSTVVTAAWEHAGYRLSRPPADAVRGLVALSSALTAPQAEHPDVLAACAWIAGTAGSRRPSAPLRRSPLVVAERWVPYAGEIFEGRVRRAGTLDGCWYRMEWRGWYDYEGGHRASVRLIDPGPLLGDTLAEMRPLGRT